MTKVHARIQEFSSGGSRSVWQKKALTSFFFSPQLILQKLNGQFKKKNYNFSRFQRGSNIFQGGGPTLSRGVQLLIPNRNPYNLWFSRGVQTPCPPPLDPHLKVATTVAGKELNVSIILAAINFLKFWILVACQKWLNKLLMSQIPQKQLDQGLHCLLFWQAYCELKRWKIMIKVFPISRIWHGHLSESCSSQWGNLGWGFLVFYPIFLFSPSLWEESLHDWNIADWDFNPYLNQTCLMFTEILRFKSQKYGSKIYQI